MNKVDGVLLSWQSRQEFSFHLINEENFTDTVKKRKRIRRCVSL